MGSGFLKRGSAMRQILAAPLYANAVVLPTLAGTVPGCAQPAPTESPPPAQVRHLLDLSQDPVLRRDQLRRPAVQVTGGAETESAVVLDGFSCFRPAGSAEQAAQARSRVTKWGPFARVTREEDWHEPVASPCCPS
jgi:hypothetical protein